MSGNLLRLSLISIVMACLQASAQVDAAPSASNKVTAVTATEKLIDQLVVNAARDRATLPSLSAHESIISKVEEHGVFGKKTMKAEATVRIVRKSPEGPLTEVRVFTAVDGKPVATNAHVSLPFDLNDSFADHQSDFFSVQNRPCYNFALMPQTGQNTPLELTITSVPTDGAPTQCKGRSGMARIDPKTHRLIHLEFAYPPQGNFSQWTASVDYAATKVGNRDYWLPSIVATHIVIRKTTNEWTGRYSDYHQYTSTSTILPADDSAQ